MSRLHCVGTAAPALAQYSAGGGTAFTSSKTHRGGCRQVVEHPGRRNQDRFETIIGSTHDRRQAQVPEFWRAL